MVPAAPLVTAHYCHGPPGWVVTETVYALPCACGGKLKVGLAALTATFAPLLVTMSPVPTRPVTVPLTAKGVVEHAMATLVTSAVTVPEALATEQTCTGPVGWPITCTV